MDDEALPLVTPKRVLGAAVDDGFREVDGRARSNSAS